MARPRKYADGTEIITISVPKGTKARLAGVPNISDLFVRELETTLNIYEQEHIDKELHKLEQESLALQKRDLELKTRMAALRKLKDHRQNAINRSLDNRLKLLEPYAKYKRRGASERELKGWLSGRIEELAECGFTGVDEAYNTLEDEYQREIKAKLVR